jgi:hypothetical protein
LRTVRTVGSEVEAEKAVNRDARPAPEVLDAPLDWTGVTDVLLVPGVELVAPEFFTNSTRTGSLAAFVPLKKTPNSINCPEEVEGARIIKLVLAVVAERETTVEPVSATYCIY